MFGAGASGLTLSSSVVSEGGYVTVCPGTTVTFTCVDTQISILSWYALPLLNEENTAGLFLGLSAGFSTTVEDIFTITLVTLEHVSDGGGDFTTTLDVVVNDQIQNRTNVTCRTNTGLESLFILKEGKKNYLYVWSNECNILTAINFSQLCHGSRVSLS